MNKLTLDLDRLRVESFSVTETAQEGGTVNAYGWSDDSICPTTERSENRSCYNAAD